MKSKDLKRISVVGRIAYGIMCAETYLINKYPNKDWTIVFNELWKITNLELWDNWMYSVAEIIPECLLEFEDYELSDFEYLTKDKYDKLRKTYSDIDDDVNTILNMIYELATSHAYSSIRGYGKESVHELIKIIKFIKKEGIDLPDFDKIKVHSFSEKEGWGNPFDGTSLSKIIK